MTFKFSLYWVGSWRYEVLWTFLSGWEPGGENRKMAISDGRECYRTHNKSRVGGGEGSRWFCSHLDRLDDIPGFLTRSVRNSSLSVCFGFSDIEFRWACPRSLPNSGTLKHLWINFFLSRISQTFMMLVVLSRKYRASCRIYTKLIFSLGCHPALSELKLSNKEQFAKTNFTLYSLCKNGDAQFYSLSQHLLELRIICCKYREDTAAFNLALGSLEVPSPSLPRVPGTQR